MSTRHTGTIRVIVVAASTALAGVSGAQTPQAPPADALERGFRQPPDSARPRVWWHWMNGNVTKEGITADLEWMKRVGIGGVQMFDASIGNILEGQWATPQFVEKRGSRDPTSDRRPARRRTDSVRATG